MIELLSVSKAYGKRRALDNFCLRVEKGELFGLVGPNGAGKTTLIKILATLQPANSGAARVDGRDVLLDPAGVRAIVGYLPDIPGLYQDMRVEEFLEFFADAFHLREPKRKQAIDRALEVSGLRARGNDYVEQLSFGMKQRLVLAKTLLHEPKVLLLDEPATGLDPMARADLRELLKSLNRCGITILLSSHILSDLEDICTRVALIADGRNAGGADGQSVIDLSAGRRSGGATIPRCEIEVLGDAQTASQAVARVAGTRTTSTEGQTLRVELPAADKGAEVLRALLDAGITVVRYDARGPSLEERYRQAFSGKTSMREKGDGRQ